MNSVPEACQFGPFRSDDRFSAARLRDECQQDETRHEVSVMTDVVSYDSDIRTLVLDSSLEIEALLANRRRSGIDRFDEVREGVLHLVPATNYQHGRIAQQLLLLFLDPAREVGLEVFMQPFNLGAGIRDFRVPDGALFPAGTDGLWFTTAPMVVEIVSTHDQSWEKLPFFGKAA